MTNASKFTAEDSVIFFADTMNLFAAPASAGMGEWTLKTGTAEIHDVNDPETFVYLIDQNKEAYYWLDHLMDFICMNMILITMQWLYYLKSTKSLIYI